MLVYSSNVQRLALLGWTVLRSRSYQKPSTPEFAVLVPTRVCTKTENTYNSPDQSLRSSLNCTLCPFIHYKKLHWGYLLRRHKKENLMYWNYNGVPLSEDSSAECLYIFEARWNVLTEGQQHGACLFSHSLIGTSIATQRWQALLRCVYDLISFNIIMYYVRITKKDTFADYTTT